MIFGDGDAGARLRLRRRHRRGAARRPSGARGGPYNIGTGIATSVAELHAACAPRRRHRRGAAAPRRRGSATCIRSVIDPRSRARELGWRAAGLARRRPRPNVGLDEGSRRRSSETSAQLWTPRSRLPTLSSAPGGPRRSSRASSPRSSCAARRRRGRSCSRSRSRTPCSTTPRRRRSHRPAKTTHGGRAHVKKVAAREPKLTRSHTGVFVFNGNGRTGAASAEAAKLSGLGYRVPRQGQRQAPGLRDDGRHVPARLGGRRPPARPRPARASRRPARRACRRLRCTARQLVVVLGAR